MAKGSKAERRAQSAAAEKAAALRKEAERKERRKRSAIIGAVAVAVVAVVAGIAVLVTSGDGGSTVAGSGGDTPAGAVSTTGGPAETQPGSYAVPWGRANAPVKVVVYEDFLCPFCRNFEVASTPVLTPYVENGDVEVQYRALKFLDRLGPYSELAANAYAVVLDVEGPEVAKNFHDGLFATQPSESGPFPDEEAVIDVAVAAGADREAVSAGIEDLAFEDWVDAGTSAAQDEGVSGTPTVFVDGEEIDPVSEQDLIAQLTQKIEAGLAG